MTIEEPLVLPKILAALVDLTDCVCASLADKGAGPTCWCGLYPGQAVAWDSCTDCGDTCGMGWVRLADAAPYREFPFPTVELRCTLPLAYRVEVGVLRCMPVNADGSPPTPQDLAEVALNQALDADAIYQGIICCGLNIGPERYLPLGPNGGCVGGMWTAIMVAD